MDYETKDTGVRVAFQTGAHRDTNSGKGRFDLMPALAMSRVVGAYWGVNRIHEPDTDAALDYAFTGLSGNQARDYLALACAEVVVLMGGWAPAMERLAKLYERGAVKYDARNWEKGIPVARMFESGLRHLCQAVGGLQDEDHYAGFLFNFVGIMEYEERADVWEDALYADLFDGLGELYYRNNPARMLAAPGAGTIIDLGPMPIEVLHVVNASLVASAVKKLPKVIHLDDDLGNK